MPGCPVAAAARADLNQVAPSETLSTAETKYCVYVSTVIGRPARIAGAFTHQCDQQSLVALWPQRRSRLEPSCPPQRRSQPQTRGSACMSQP